MAGVRVKSKVELLRQITALPLFSLGLASTLQRLLKQLAPVADGVIIGSALVDLIDKNSRLQLSCWIKFLALFVESKLRSVDKEGDLAFWLSKDPVNTF